jgi:hypothetical protein
LSVSQLIDKLNPILKGFSTYFNWSCSYRLLNWLDFFIFKRIFLYLSKKFKKFSKRVIIERYFREVNGKRWVLVGTYFNSESNNLISNQNIKMLSSCTELSTLPLYAGRLLNKLKSANYFLRPAQFSLESSKIWRRRKGKSLEYLLLNTQKGICLYCEYFIDLREHEVHLYHLYELRVCKTKEQIQKSNKRENFMLLHASCYRVLHSKYGVINKKFKFLK